MTRTASRLCPPSSKKASRRPTRGAARHAAKSSAISSSSASTGGSYARLGFARGAGSARRSTFPFDVIGSPPITTKHDGTM